MTKIYEKSQVSKPRGLRGRIRSAPYRRTPLEHRVELRAVGAGVRLPRRRLRRSSLSREVRQLSEEDEAASRPLARQDRVSIGLQKRPRESGGALQHYPDEKRRRSALRRGGVHEEEDQRGV